MLVLFYFIEQCIVSSDAVTVAGHFTDNEGDVAVGNIDSWSRLSAFVPLSAFLLVLATAVEAHKAALISDSSSLSQTSTEAARPHYGI